MDPRELVRFLNVLKHYVSPFWRRRIEDILQKYGWPVT